MKNGHEVTELKVSKNYKLDYFFDLIKKNQFDLIFSLDGKLLLLRKFVKRIIEFINCPVCIFLLDDPSYHFNSIKEIINRD